VKDLGSIKASKLTSIVHKSAAPLLQAGQIKGDKQKRSKKLTPKE